jgi:hypothetical protein
MSANASQVIVTLADVGLCVHTSYAYHRDYPEIRVEGKSPRAAAEQLADRLAFAFNSAPIGWHQIGVEQALADVRALVEQTVT